MIVDLSKLPSHLNLREVLVLCTLAEADNLTVTEVATQSAVNGRIPSTSLTSRCLSDLEEEQLVKRLRPTKGADRRIQRVQITEQGRTLVESFKVSGGEEPGDKRL